jgi:hypothetical protein
LNLMDGKIGVPSCIRHAGQSKDYELSSVPNTTHLSRLGPFQQLVS